jgi:hypothetical protein
MIPLAHASTSAVVRGADTRKPSRWQIQLAVRLPVGTRVQTTTPLVPRTTIALMSVYTAVAIRVAVTPGFSHQKIPVASVSTFRR